MTSRRDFLLTGVAVLGSASCQPVDELAHISGGFVGSQHLRGHLLQGGQNWPAPSVTRTTEVLIAGGGVAGLAAARALRLQGREDFALLELEDQVGGNSRSGTLAGLACPLGAHYLPLPGDAATEVQDFLEELGLRQRISGRWQFDERHLCHSPQERLFFNAAWQAGLLPLQGVGPGTLAQYQKFAALVAQAQHQARWTIPVSKAPLVLMQRALAAMTFESWLAQQGLTDRHLRWYLDYCCRDDYGAGTATVSAWAGLHYFASRHGFAAPGSETGEPDGLLTWPEGNGWLTRRLAEPLGQRLHSGCVVLRLANVKHGIEADVLNTATLGIERWQARRAIVALPVFVAARVLENPPDWLRQAARHMVYAPWLVANIHINSALQDRPGAPPSWDNVIYGNTQTAPGLGYVDASHQRLQSVPGATVLSYYRALGDWPNARPWLLQQSWATWRNAIIAELSLPHPDLAAKVTRIDISRYGHAMAVPVPGFMDKIGLWPLSKKRNLLSKSYSSVPIHGRLALAHSDWAGYSVFEEAFTLGHTAA